MIVASQPPDLPDGYVWVPYTFSPCNHEPIGWTSCIARKPNEGDDELRCRAEGFVPIDIAKPEFIHLFRGADKS